MSPRKHVLWVLIGNFKWVNNCIHLEITIFNLMNIMCTYFFQSFIPFIKPVWIQISWVHHNSKDHDQMASDEASWSGSKLFLTHTMNGYLSVTSHINCIVACCFVRGGPTLTFFFFFFYLIWGGRIQNTTLSGAIISPPAKRWLMCWWWPNIECWLGGFVIFQGIWTSIAKKSYFLQFSGGSRPPVPHLDLCMLI